MGILADVRFDERTLGEAFENSALPNDWNLRSGDLQGRMSNSIAGKEVLHVPEEPFYRAG